MDFFGLLLLVLTGSVLAHGLEFYGDQQSTNASDGSWKNVTGEAKSRPVRATSAVDTNDRSVQQSIVDIHNNLRRRIPTTSTLKMSWDNDAQRVAQKWADKCEFRHPTSQSEKDTFLKAGKLGCGQNIAYGTGPLTWSKVIKDMWHGEIKDFRFGQTPTGVVGHYTAIVWKNSYKVGCAYAKCPKLGNFFVCDYCPAGNVVPNQYKPYDAGVACAKCKNDCDRGLCTHPCEYQNELSNCEVSDGGFNALFPKDCNSGPQSLKAKCQATCNCKGKYPY